MSHFFCTFSYSEQLACSFGKKKNNYVNLVLFMLCFPEKKNKCEYYKNCT